MTLNCSCSHYNLLVGFSCLPMNLAQNELTHVMKDRQKIGASLADIDPMSLDRSVSFFYLGVLFP